MNRTTTRDYLADPLWARISKHPFDESGAIYPFSAKLANEQQWRPEFTNRVLEEYRRFIYLCCISPNGASPSKKVDEAWHLHLTYTVNYWQRFCKETLQRDIHHHPSAGGEAQKDKYDKLYNDTLELYEQVFHQLPPADIWDPPFEQPKPLEETYEGAFRYKGYWPTVLMLLPFFITGILFRQVDPFRLSGIHFLVFYGLLAITSSIAVLLVVNRKRDKLREISEELTPGLDAHELAYLAGGRDRFLLSCLSGLLSEGYLKHLGKGQYKLEEDFRNAKHNPAVKYLACLDAAEPYTLIQFKPFMVQAFREVEQRFSKLVLAFTEQLHRYVLPGIAVIIGIARMTQGVSNDKPVNFLVLMIFLLLIVNVVLGERNDFHNAFRSTLDRNELEKSNTMSQSGLDVLFGGLNGITNVMAVDQLIYVHAILENKQNGSSGSGGCGSSCSGGGGCGGGCGGCGGS